MTTTADIIDALDEAGWSGHCIVRALAALTDGGRSDDAHLVGAFAEAGWDDVRIVRALDWADWSGQRIVRALDETAGGAGQRVVAALIAAGWDAERIQREMERREKHEGER